MEEACADEVMLQSLDLSQTPEGAPILSTLRPPPRPPQAPFLLPSLT